MWNKMHTFETTLAGRKLTIEVGKFAKQANAACTVQYGETKILATAVMGKEPKVELDYFPLTVDYEERLYAAGKIKGSRFIKREGRPSDEAILSGRLIDRSIRPLFNDTLRNEVQVLITVLSVDGENPSELPSMVGASCALAISDIPWKGPIGAVNIGCVNNELVINPTEEQKEAGTLDLFVTGFKDRILMIETTGREVPEETIKKGLELGLKNIAQVIDFIANIQKEIGVEKSLSSSQTLIEEETQALTTLSPLVEQFYLQHCSELFGIKTKMERDRKITALSLVLHETLKTQGIEETILPHAKKIFQEKLDYEARRSTLEEHKRVDGRKLDELRDISCEVGLLPRTHGSGLFNRGETQVLSIVTLGAPGDEQTLDGMEETGVKRYMHHYNFPGFSTGEVKPIRGPGRREIGHGALAEKALLAVLPEKEQFPYTIRVVSEVLSSNGSSSQASVCGSTLALMDAGVPITAPVAGIAMGIIMSENGNEYTILTDIQGVEDHAGDMDFKIAGTRQGVTAIQLDVKCQGLTIAMCEETLQQARKARGEILDHLESALSKPRAELSKYAPRILSLKIDPEKIGEVIGKGGETIKKIIEECGGQDICKIDIEDDGLVLVTTKSVEHGEKAITLIQNLTREIQIGEVFEGVVTRIVRDKNTDNEIGAIVEILPGHDGMVHISEFSNERIDRVTSVVDINQKIQVKVIDVDKERGRIILSHKAVLNGNSHSEKYLEQRKPYPEKRDFMPRNSFHDKNKGRTKNQY
jgi:polyribonucleotide nucleotidyltransferase